MGNAFRSAWRGRPQQDLVGGLNAGDHGALAPTRSRLRTRIAPSCGGRRSEGRAWKRRVSPQRIQPPATRLVLGHRSFIEGGAIRASLIGRSWAGGTLVVSHPETTFIGTTARVRRRHAAMWAGPTVWGTRLMLVLSDVTAIVLSVLLASVLWTLVQPLADPASLRGLWPVALLFPVGFAFLGLYPAAGVSAVTELRRSSLLVSAVFASVLGGLFLSHEVAATSRGIFLLAWLLLLVAVPTGRAATRLLFARRPWWGMPALVLGAGSTAKLLIDSLERDPGLDLKVLGCLDDDREKWGRMVGGVPVLGRLVDAPRLQRVRRVRYGIVAMPGVDPERLSNVVRRHAHVFPHLVIIPNLFGLTSVGVGTRDLGGFVGLYNKQNLLLPHNRVLKRVMDLLLLVPALLVAAPLIALAALAVVLVSPGNPFYAQRREGHRGKPIAVWKLRTMRSNADAFLERHLQQNAAAREEWNRHFKLAYDPRILPVVGKLLRRTSIDELPQLLNIIKGEMSFVGPRPFPYYHLEQFGGEFRRLRTSVLPGLTGQWQVTSRGTADLAAQEQLDSHYIRNWSLWMDVYLIARTPWAVLFGKGAY